MACKHFDIIPLRSLLRKLLGKDRDKQLKICLKCGRKTIRFTCEAGSYKGLF